MLCAHQNSRKRNATHIWHVACASLLQTQKDYCFIILDGVLEWMVFYVIAYMEGVQHYNLLQFKNYFTVIALETKIRWQ